MKYNFWKHSPLWLLIAIIITGIFALFPLFNLLALAFKNFILNPNAKLTLEELGQFGDFLGGHTTAFSGALTLAVVLFFTFHQSNQQSEHFHTLREETRTDAERAFFLTGINLVTQWDIKYPGCDQCMRLLDYYSRLALKSKDKELLLILNTVITAEIKTNLNGGNGSFKQTNYPFAYKAVDQIAAIRKEEGLQTSKNKIDAITTKY